MKKSFLSLILFFSVSSSFGQGISILSLNNVNAHLMDNGYFFNQCALQTAGYEIPKGSDRRAIYTSSFWFGARDVNNQLKICAPTYCNNSNDLWPGPLNVNTGSAIVPNPFSNTMWSVTSWDISNHIANYQTPGYIVPSSIENWPAHGDVSVGADYYLAPFVDVNNNGIYEPQLGDYPCIKGDMATFIIMNDAQGVHGSGGSVLNVELHFMFYQFLTNDFLNNTTFIDLKVINRGTQTLYDFYTTYFVDADLGNYTDDYVGSDSSRNLMYTYNGDSFDESFSGSLGYGGIPPAIGVVSLSHDVTSIGAYSSIAVTPYNMPSNPAEIYNTMNTQWQDSSHWLDNNGINTNFMFSGDPNVSTEWSEVSEMNTLGDRRMVMNIKYGILAPSEQYELSYAIVYGKGTDNLNSVTKLLQTTDSIQNFYNQLTQNCFNPLTVGIEEVNELKFEVSPNPSSGVFNIQMPKKYTNMQIVVKDAFGKIVYKENKHNVNNMILDLNEAKGVYFITIITENGQLTKKLILN